MLATRLRLTLMRLAPFLGRWSEAAPAACCGMCGSCLTATASGLTLEVIGGVKRRAGDAGAPPIACTLGPAEMGARQSLIDALIVDGVLDRTPIDSGVRLRLRRTPEIAQRTRDLVAAESQCCRFLDFELREDARDLVLDITGPPEAQPFVAQVFTAGA